MPDTLTLLAIMAGVTYLSRLLPFIVFHDRRLPRWLVTIETILPPLALWLLVLYSLNDVSWRVAPYGIPALAGVAIVVLVHRWKRNALYSIVAGVAVYMVLLRVMA